MVSVRVNGKQFMQFKQVDVSRGMDSLSGEARIIVSEQIDNSSFIVIQDLVEIFLDEIQVITGYAEKISDSESVSSHDISFRIRDKVADIIDSSVPDNLKTKEIEGVRTFSELCSLGITGLGLAGDIEVIDEVGATINADDIKAAEVGATLYEYLNEYARKIQVFLNTDGKGNLLLRNQYSKLKTILVNVRGFQKNNILDSNIDLDYSKRFYKYIVRSNSSLASADKNVNDLNNEGIVIDNEIKRQSRIFEKMAESPMTSEECKRAAQEEANIRRIRGFNYTCSVVGFSANGQLWDIGKLVDVKDQKREVIGEFLIKEVSWSSSGQGEITSMTLTYPDAYQAVAETSTLTQKTTAAAQTYTVKKGDALYKIARKYNISLQKLVSANPQIENPNLIFPNQRVIIPIENEENIT